MAAAFATELPPAPASAQTVLRLAAEFDLAPRIVARHGIDALTERLGPDASGMLGAHRRSVAAGMVGELLARQLGALAARARLTILFLKGHALQLVSPGPPGWRPYVDLDVLVSREGAAQLAKLLVAEGWRSEAEAGNPQHLPPLVAPEGLPVDLHFRLRGIRVGAARWATLEELLATDLCLPLAAPAEAIWVPRPALLAAHVAAHAVEQHGHRPATYPLLRAVADIADLAAVEDLGELADAARPLVAESVSEEELDALFTLARVLGEGRLPNAGDTAEAGAETLLRHIMAGTLDPVYRRGLAIDHTAGRLRQARQDGDLMRYISRKLKGPNEAPPIGPGGSSGDPGAGGRLLRLLRLGARFASAAAARLRRSFDR